MDMRPGEKVITGAGGHRFEDQVDPDVLGVADAVLRAWMPPVLLENLGYSTLKDGAPNAIFLS